MVIIEAYRSKRVKMRQRETERNGERDEEGSAQRIVRIMWILPFYIIC